jgi:aminopeptidase Y
MDVGLAWKARLAAGEDLVVNLLVDSVFEERESWNVIAETKDGDPNNVIMLGAHLDSVQAGPGINDDGSGTTAMIEIMTKIRYYRNLKNKVRIAFWGAEEAGLIGSLFYTASLSEEEADKIRFYFNYDMIGSPYPIYSVYQGDNPGDAFGAKALYDYLTAAGKPAEYAPFGTSSDYLGFLEIGIPSSGLFTGAGAPTDPCYHLACDDIKNINWDTLTVNAKAAAKVLAEFALSDLKDLPRRTKTSINPRSRTQIRNQLQKLKVLSETAEHSHSCAHKGKSTV